MSSIAPQGLPPRAPRRESRNIATAPEVRPQPTATGLWLDNTLDALIVIQAVVDGKCNVISCRPGQAEMPHLIKSGNVFVYHEAESGIKRWTDPKDWSPSRSITGYLGYRELNAPFPPGQKKRAKRSRPTSGGVVKQEPGGRHGRPSTQAMAAAVAAAAAARRQGSRANVAGDLIRRLYGSLIDSYDFKDGGLMKKTLTITANKKIHHIVNYYDPIEVILGQLKRPLQTEELWAEVWARFELKQDDFFAEVQKDLHRDEGGARYVHGHWLDSILLQGTGGSDAPGGTQQSYAPYPQPGLYEGPLHMQTQQAYNLPYVDGQYQQGVVAPRLALGYGPAQMQTAFPPHVEMRAEAGYEYGAPSNVARHHMDAAMPPLASGQHTLDQNPWASPTVIYADPNAVQPKESAETGGSFEANGF